MNRTLEELDDQFKGNPYGSVPVYEGGPVGKDKIIVAAWEWMKESSLSSCISVSIWKKWTTWQKTVRMLKLPASSATPVGHPAVGG